MNTKKPVKIGILGTADIAHAFTASCLTSSKVNIIAIASRDSVKAKNFADKYNLKFHFSNYSELLNCPEIDAVYIPLPNSLHVDWIKKSLQAGKHVLCEKPLALSETDAVDVFNLAQRNNLRLFEGYPYRHQPLITKLQEVIQKNIIGKIEMIHADFSYICDDQKNIRFDQNLGGGVHWDAGCYPISFIRMIIEERPDHIHSFSNKNNTDVPTSLIANFKYKSGQMAQVSCSFNSPLYRRAVIKGTKGIIETNFWNNPESVEQSQFKIILHHDDVHSEEIIQTDFVSGFLSEAECFAEAVSDADSKWQGTTPSESIDIAWMLEQLKLPH